MKQNNKGFSLVELIVAIAIFAIAGLALVAFMSTTSNSYTRSSKDISLQAEQQLAVNQVRDLILDSSNGIYFDDASDTLKIFGQSTLDPGGAALYPLTVISLSGGQLKFGTGEFAAIDEHTTIAAANQKLLAEHIDSFSVDLTKAETEGQVKFTIVFKIDDKTLTANETVSLRNKLVVSTEQNEIWGAAPEAINSFITKINIRRGMTLFDVGGTDEIGTNSANVAAVYSAEVMANEASERVYLVDWSISGVAGAAMPAGITLSDETGNEVKVNVDGAVADGTQFELRATSVDDQTKYTNITITVKNTGVYPSTMTLTKSILPEDTVEGNGYRSYKLIPHLEYTPAPDGSVSYIEDPAYFNWEVITEPLPDEGTDGTGTGNTQVPDATGTQEGTEPEEPEPLPIGCSFDPATGVMVLSSSANNRKITVRATAKERDSLGDKLFAEVIFEETDIPEYILEPALLITVNPQDLIRGGYVTATVDVINVTPDEEAKYIYSWEVEDSYGKDTTQWDVLSNTEFKNVSIAPADTEVYDESHADHEAEYGEERYGDAKTINLTCDTDLNWSYNYDFVLIARARDEEGNEIVAERTIRIPKVELLIEPTTANAAIRDHDNLTVLTDSVLSYEDWYLRNSRDKEPGWYDSTNPHRKGVTSTARRWFTMDLKGLKPTDEEWNNDYTFKQNYLFRNQIFAILNDRIVQKPTGEVLTPDKLCNFTANLYYWERLANRPVYMNYSVEMKDPATGNSVTSDPRQYIIVYESYGKLIFADTQTPAKPETEPTTEETTETEPTTETTEETTGSPTEPASGETDTGETNE